MSVKLLMNNIASKIWIGWIPQDLDGTGIGITKEEEMAEGFNKKVMNFGIANGSLMEMDAQVIGKYSLGIVFKSSMTTLGAFFCIFRVNSLPLISVFPIAFKEPSI